MQSNFTFTAICEFFNRRFKVLYIHWERWLATAGSEPSCPLGCAFRGQRDALGTQVPFWKRESLLKHCLRAQLQRLGEGKWFLFRITWALLHMLSSYSTMGSWVIQRGGWGGWKWHRGRKEREREGRRGREMELTSPPALWCTTPSDSIVLEPNTLRLKREKMNLLPSLPHPPVGSGTSRISVPLWIHRACSNHTNWTWWMPRGELWSPGGYSLVAGWTW